VIDEVHDVQVDLWADAHRRRLVRLCAAITGNPDVADDLAQETLLEAWRHRDRLIDPSGAERWLAAIARNVCRRWARTQGRTVSVDCVGDQVAPDLELVLEREELVELLERALALLPPQTRDVLVSHYVREVPHAEIAARLGITTDAVSMRVTRGKARLRSLLETRFHDDTVAEGWVSRDDMGWRATRQGCAKCGRLGVSMRHDVAAGVVAFRCPGCDEGSIASQFQLDNPTFSGLIGELRRPSAILGRVGPWLHTYWHDGIRSGHVACTRCTQRVDVRAYVRPEPYSWSTRNGWHATCSHCGEEATCSVGGLAMAAPEVRELHKRYPRLRSVPERDVTHQGVPAVVVGFVAGQRSGGVEAIFARDTLRPLGILST
jgi:RNA polymerase sigma-70 factor (ECF subfamily)